MPAAFNGTNSTWSLGLANSHRFSTLAPNLSVRTRKN